MLIRRLRNSRSRLKHGLVLATVLCGFGAVGAHRYASVLNGPALSPALEQLYADRGLKREVWNEIKPYDSALINLLSEDRHFSLEFGYAWVNGSPNLVDELVVSLSVSQRYIWSGTFMGFVPPAYRSTGQIDFSHDDSLLLSLTSRTEDDIRIPVGKLKDEWLSRVIGDRERTELVLKGTLQATSVIWSRLVWDLALLANYVIMVSLVMKLITHARNRRRVNHSLCQKCGYPLEGLPCDSCCPECGSESLVRA